MPKRIQESIREEVLARLAAEQQIGSRLSVDKLYQKLLERHGGNPGIGRTTLAKLIKQARERMQGTPPPELPWDPSPLAWTPEAYAFLLALNRHCIMEEGPANDVWPWPEGRELTSREAKWGAQLHSVCRNTPIEIGYLVVKTLAEREILSEVYARSFDIADVIGFLEFKPWESQADMEDYNLACHLGRIPNFLRFKTDESPPAEDREDRKGYLKLTNSTVDVQPSSLIEEIIDSAQEP